MNPAICASVNNVANVDLDPESGAVRSAQAPQLVVQLVSVNAGKRTDITVSNPPPELTFEVGQPYELSLSPAPKTPTDAVVPPPPA